MTSLNNNLYLKNFITVDGTKLMDGNKELRFISYNYPGALFNGDEGGRMPTAFEQEDAIRTIKQTGGKVFRTYSLTVRSHDNNVSSMRHIIGPGEINEKAFRSMDKLLQLANQYKIRVIIPFIDNWDWPPGGISQFANYRGRERLEFYTDPQIIEDFKKVIEKVMNRSNVFTGVRYKDDPTILGWETGNELMIAPKWMSEIAKFYKQINQNQLLISGNQMELPHYYQNITDEALINPNIDIVKSHYYEGNYAAKVKQDKAKATAYDKPFFVGEFGFKPTIEVKAMIDEVISGGTSGALIWSLRPHSFEGGYIQHKEYEVDGIRYRSYHWPGLPSGDYMDAKNVMHLLRNKAYEIQGKVAPEIAAPANAPEFIKAKRNTDLKWRGVTGASSYVIERTENINAPWEIIAERVLDDVSPGDGMFYDSTVIPNQQYYYRVKAVNCSGESEYSNVMRPLNV